jgi:uncharacterized protein YaaQ
MKLVFAIVNADDAQPLAQELLKNGFSATTLASTGSFLMASNFTVLVGVDEEKLQEVIDLVKACTHRREEIRPASRPYSIGYYPSQPMDVIVGGATIFVVDMERFERV